MSRADIVNNNSARAVLADNVLARRKVLCFFC